MAMGKIPLHEVLAIKSEIAELALAKEQERIHWDADDRVHQMFPDASGNLVLAQMIRQVRITTRLFEFSKPTARVKEDGIEHLAILDAYLSGDADAAAAAMRQHLRNLSADAMALLSGAA